MTTRPFTLPFLCVAERFLGLRTLQALYERRRHGNFMDEALRLLDITIASDGDLANVPSSGPLLVIANHPSGPLDGLALAHLLQKRRSDVKLFANRLLARIPELREHIIGVDTFRRGADHLRALRDARRWLARGGVVIVFPAGEVSSVPSADGGIVDREWQRGILRLVSWTGAAILPAYIHAQNSETFVRAGRVHPWLRTVLLGRELLARRGTTLRVSVGMPIGPARLQQLPDDPARLSYLRARTYALGHERLADLSPAVPPAAAERPEVMAAEIAALPARAKLLTSGKYTVYSSTPEGMPAVMREIGRLREITFRAVGEGTGRERDLDDFDNTYTHLFVWDEDRRCIVGAYRLGLTDRLGAIAESRRLYTRSLFRFGEPLLRQLGPAIELGRSFVRVECQRETNALFLLWRGIGAFVAREPRYRFLFGAVSISARYQSLTRQLLARYLSGDRFLSSLATLVRPSRPLPVGREAADLVRSKVVTNLQDVEMLVAELEGGRGVPVLLRHYLKLNARLLGFSVDPAFGNVLDGLLLVDLLDVKPALLERYLGREHARAVLAFHGRTAADVSAAYALPVVSIN